jgi:Protein of unknown function (DUF3179)
MSYHGRNVPAFSTLCLSGVVYDPQVSGNRLTFGVTGKLCKSGLVMYDRETQSLWSQLLQQAITGPLTGSVLRMLPAEHTTWEYWRAHHPESLVLSPETGFKRDYGLNPYREYWEQGRPRFRSADGNATTKTKSQIRPMERVLGIEVSGIHKAYPFSILKKKSGQFADQVGNKEFFIHFDKKSETAYVSDQTGVLWPSITVFWFAWQDFYPQTLVYE